MFDDFIDLKRYVLQLSRFDVRIWMIKFNALNNEWEYNWEEFDNWECNDVNEKYSLLIFILLEQEFNVRLVLLYKTETLIEFNDFEDSGLWRNDNDER